MRQEVNVRSGDAAVVGIVCVAMLSVFAVLALMAVMVVALVVIGCVASVALVATGGLKYARYRAEAQAAVELWRERKRAEAGRTESITEAHAIIMQLATPPKPRIALAMRRLQDSTPYLGGRHTVQQTQPAPKRADVAWWHRPTSGR